MILITKDIFFDGETDLLNRFLEYDIYVHVRKPMAAEKQLRIFLDKLNSEHFHKISIHYFHELASEYGLGGLHFSTKNRNDYNPITYNNKRISFSLHARDERVSLPDKTSYVFISPVWDSISKKGYHSAGIDPFAFKIPGNIKKVALGGVDVHNLQKTLKLGFDDVAVCGAVWESSDPLAAFVKMFNIVKKCKQEA
ncbi:MAG: thiamine phosphate synthase [Bacteroidia bacterium]|nr:thiamine phosphate synthase [Bacteroidia bacterium]